MTGRRVAVVAAVAFLLLTLLVAAGATGGVDTAVRDTMRPGDVWGDPQVTADLVVEGLRPEVLLVVMWAVGGLTSLLRRTWRAAAYTGLLVVAATVPALVVKRALERTDPHDEMSSIGSFPSGHVLFVLVGLGGMLLVTRARTRWWEWALVGTGTVVMGICLLLQAAHWSTDVIGGALLGVTVLGAAQRSALRSAPRSAPEPVPTGPRRRW